VKFSIAVNRQFSSNGEREVDFINCIVWRKQAENMAKYQTKGNLIGVDGRIQTGSYQDKEGRTIYTTDVVCDSVQYLETKKDTPPKLDHDVRPVQPRDVIDVDEDSLPF
jgi:single-strand DNA-binding protein